MTIITVAVAVLGTIVVAWQAYETHRTTTLSQQTLEASHSLAIDSARSRLDQDAPRIDVYVEQVSVLSGDSGDAAAPRVGAVSGWRLPADDGRLLRVQARVKVVNLMSHRTIHLKVSGLDDPAGRADTEVLLIPSAGLLYFLTATFALSQWAENWQAHHAGTPLPHIAAGSVIAGDDRDEGVVDTWPLSLAAWPIEPAGDKAGTWDLTSGGAGDDWFRIAIRPLRERSYWISQRRNIPLPEPSYDKPG
ncbi:MAG: hypothetical protein J2P33_13305 [Actinobacteria bacterium]|nr:hypothetical protein [Actinomycetota bacterium]